MLICNSVIVSVFVVLIMCVFRINVVIALTTGALVAGIVDGFSLKDTVDIFAQGLGGGAKIAISYAMLGAFASAIAHSGLPNFLMAKVAHLLHLRSRNRQQEFSVTSSDHRTTIILLLAIGIMSIACKNVIPVHIAFIPILIPPLLGVFNKMNIDRRAVTCVITFGLIVAYMVIPVGFGEIFLDNILAHYLSVNGLAMTVPEIIHALLLPVIGMSVGLCCALFYYRKPRYYEVSEVKTADENSTIVRKEVIISTLAIFAALVVQIVSREIILSALGGFLVLSLGGVVRRKDSDNVVADGFKMMAVISFTMLAAAGFGNVLHATGGIHSLINWIAEHAVHNKALSSLSMLFVGFLISVGIGSSFSTVPIVATVYVPLGIKLGLSPAAIAVIVAISGVVGDAGSPSSDSTLGPTMGLNADGQHSLVYDSAIPSFIFLSVPAFICGWISSIIL